MYFDMSKSEATGITLPSHTILSEYTWSPQHELHQKTPHESLIQCTQPAKDKLTIPAHLKHTNIINNLHLTFKHRIHHAGREDYRPSNPEARLRWVQH